MSKLIPIEYRNQRVITTKVLSDQFGTEENSIKVNFSRNSARFDEGKHYYKLEGAELADFKNLVTDSNLVDKRAPALILWTERGAARHAKILETDEAWQVYEMLEETYFRAKALNPYQGLSKELQAIFVQDKKIQAVETRVEKLENTMTIDYTQQEILRELANRSVVDALGGKSSMAYKMIRGKAFSEFWKHYKRTMQVNSYRNTPTVDFEKAKEVMLTWKPDKELGLMIIGANTQVRPA